MMKLDIDALKIERWLRTGHPRSVGLLFGHSTPNDAWDGVEIESVRVCGRFVTPHTPADEVSKLIYAREQGATP